MNSIPSNNSVLSNAGILNEKPPPKRRHQCSAKDQLVQDGFLSPLADAIHLGNQRVMSIVFRTFGQRTPRHGCAARYSKISRAKKPGQYGAATAAGGLTLTDSWRMVH